ESSLCEGVFSLSPISLPSTITKTHHQENGQTTQQEADKISPETSRYPRTRQEPYSEYFNRDRIIPSIGQFFLPTPSSLESIRGPLARDILRLASPSSRGANSATDAGDGANPLLWRCTRRRSKPS
ncbi:hypothetical protein JI435_022470, partial [Parastagonospora nodorum SN15]